MTEIGFNVDARLIPTGDMQGRYMCGPSGANALPPMMNKKIFGEAAGKIVRLADIYRVPHTVRAPTAENVDAGLGEVASADIVLLKGVFAP